MIIACSILLLLLLILPSVFFRVNPWQMLLHLLSSVSLLLLILLSVYFRVRPWLMLLRFRHPRVCGDPFFAACFSGFPPTRE